MNPFLVALAFVFAFLPVPSSRRQPASGDDWPITDYERGVSGPLKRAHDDVGRERYVSRPTMRRLVRDLRRPAARADARQALLARVPDGDLRAWVSIQIGKGRVNRLSVYAREGIRDEIVLAAWQAELDAEQAAEADVVEEAQSQATMLRALMALASKNPPEAKDLAKNARV
jgi:hypothetical protein